MTTQDLLTGSEGTGLAYTAWQAEVFTVATGEECISLHAFNMLYLEGLEAASKCLTHHAMRGRRAEKAPSIRSHPFTFVEGGR